MRPIRNESRAHAEPPLSRHDKKIAQRANDFMDVFKNFDFSAAGHITCLIYLLAPKAVKLRDGDNDFNGKFAQFSNELDLALGKSKKEENRSELKSALIRLIAERGLPQKYQEDYQKISGNRTIDGIIDWLKEVRKEVYRPKMASRPQSQIIASVHTTTTANQFLTTTTTPVIRFLNSYRSIPTPQQEPTGYMMPSYPNSMHVNQMLQPNAYFSAPAPAFNQAPAIIWYQGQPQPYPGTANWPQQQQQWQYQNLAPQQQYFYPPQQNGGTFNSGS